MDQVIEPVVKQDLRIERHDHVNANEHLEHPLVQVEIDWTGCLIRRTGPVKVGVFTFAPDCQFELKWTIPTPIIIDVVLKRFRFSRQVLDNQLAHRPIGAQ